MTPEVLNHAIRDLVISDELRSFLMKYGFSNLGELLASDSVPELLNREGFNYHCLVELYKLLDESGRGELLRERVVR